VSGAIGVARRSGWPAACLCAAVVFSSCGSPGHHATEPTDSAATVTVPSNPTTLPTTTALSGQPALQPDRSLQFVNDKDGWLIAGEHTILATTDGGDNWQTRYNGPDHPREVDFVGQEDGWVIADESESFSGLDVLLRTTDGGQSWTNLGAPLGAVLMTIDFSGPDTGWALTTMGTVLGTTDAGVHWSKLAAPVAASLCTTATGPLWLGTVTGNIEESVNHGTTWKVSLPWAGVPKESNTQLGSSVGPWVMCSGTDAWALYDWGEAAGSSLYVALTTNDGGNSWTPLLGDEVSGSLHALPTVSNSVAAAGASDGGSAWFLGYCGPCGKGTVEIVTSNGSSAPLTAQLPEVALDEEPDASFADSAHGWVVGTSSAAGTSSGGYPLEILATTDGGMTWHTISTIPAPS
jgi:hypothetical protein